jgi:soluble lytic murein transglycosylase-like protein
MQERIQKIVILLGGVIFVLLAMTADASKVDLDSQWENYTRHLSANEPAYRFPHATCFKAAALRYGLPETLLLAVARGESDFEPTARSRANAHGVMQILWPGTARHLGINRLSDLYDPCTNIDAGSRYLKELLGNYDGNVHLALAAYNYGPGRIPKNGFNKTGPRRTLFGHRAVNTSDIRRAVPRCRIHRATGRQGAGP